MERGIAYRQTIIDTEGLLYFSYISKTHREATLPPANKQLFNAAFIKGEIMKKITIFVVALVFLSVSTAIFAQESDIKKRGDPFACIGEATSLGKEMSTSEITDEISNRLAALKPYDARSSCIIAELMKRVGDYRAEDYYKKAIDADNTEPAYELFYADYLRNFRGPQRPLFPDAEKHYYEALRKLRKLEQTKNWQDFDAATQKRVERGLKTLYQEDGLPLLHWKSEIIEPNKFLERPFVFFSTINKYAKSTTDFDEVDDIRDFTAEALFAGSESRLNRDLSKDKLKGIIRAREQFETLNRLRFRYSDLPAFEIFYKYRKIDNAQITNFNEPNKFNDVNLNEYGIALEKPFNVSPYFDFFLRGIYKRVKREGLIEFLPDEKEDVNHYEAKLAISRFFGPDKANLEFTYVFQDIDQDISNPSKRDRQIFGATLTYQIFKERAYEQRFEPRGLDLFGGIAIDKERFDSIDVKKRDYFAGAAFKGIPFIKENAFDVIIQPTIFTYKVAGDESQDNSQYRTNVTLLYRIKDEEKAERGFLHLVIPFRHDIAIDGPNDFENFKVGTGLNTKFLIRKTTFLASISYDYQRFYRLNKNLNLFSFNVSMGF